MARQAALRQAALRRATWRRMWLALGAGAACVALVMLPALWNGFPILFPDTGGYLARPFEGTLELGRSALYGAFLAAGIPVDFWLNVVLQAALCVWLIALTLRAHDLSGTSVLVATVAALCVATGMPWYAGTLIPDILVSAAILSLYLLAFRGERLRRWETIALGAVIAFAIASHMGTLALCLGLIVCLAGWIVVRKYLRGDWPKPRLLTATLAVGAGLLLAPLSNLIIADEFAFTPGGESFVFGRLVQDGIVANYLEDRCPNPDIKLCAYRQAVPDTADEWLWGPGNPLGELGGWRGYADEARFIIFDSLKRYPLEHLETAVTTTLKQLALMETEVSLVKDWMAPAIGSLRELVPQMTPRIAAARQQAEPFPDLLARFNTIHVATALASLVLLVGLLAFARQRLVPPETLMLAGLVLTALLINAAVCGIFSNPVDRYQSRILWLAPFAVIIALGARTQRR
jgi:hypothetical protein